MLLALLFRSLGRRSESLLLWDLEDDLSLFLDSRVLSFESASSFLSFLLLLLSTEGDLDLDLDLDIDLSPVLTSTSDPIGDSSLLAFFELLLFSLSTDRDKDFFDRRLFFLVFSLESTLLE